MSYNDDEEEETAGDDVAEASEETDSDNVSFCELCGCSEDDDDELLRCEECGRLHCSGCREYDEEGSPYCADCHEELSAE